MVCGKNLPVNPFTTNTMLAAGDFFGLELSLLSSEFWTNLGIKPLGMLGCSLHAWLLGDQGK